MTRLTVATCNDDWASVASNYAEVAGVDVVLIQEGKRAKYASLVDKRTRGVLQDTSDPAKAGSVVIWTLAMVLRQATGLTFAVKASGLLIRYLAWLRATVGGRRVLFIAGHRPPKRTAKWWHPFDLALAARVRAATTVGRLVVVGLDANEGDPQKMASLCGLVWHSTGPKHIDGFLMSKAITMSGIKLLPKGSSDHQPVVATIEIPAKSKPKPPPVPPAPHGFMPGVAHEPIPAGSNDPPIIPCGVIQHIAVSNATDIHSIFTDGRGIESHFYILKNGTIIQYRSIFFEADAQFAGNSFGSPRRGFISVEHQGGVGADLNVPMPQAQLDAFHRVVLWVKSQSDFPLRVCPSWNAPGVGYHALFDEWNTNHHSCPGPARINQFHDVTVPWLKAGGKP